mgnify:CR=1 FL=1
MHLNDLKYWGMKKITNVSYHLFLLYYIYCLLAFKNKEHILLAKGSRLLKSLSTLTKRNLFQCNHCTRVSAILFISWKLWQPVVCIRFSKSLLRSSLNFFPNIFSSEMCLNKITSQFMFKNNICMFI